MKITINRLILCKNVRQFDEQIHIFLEQVLLSGIQTESFEISRISDVHAIFVNLFCYNLLGTSIIKTILSQTFS